ncbi:MAG TPA: helix-turn-helix domain-containing protein [Lachnospiraceae bacterium]|nr:helix-turn-helix domain-containing protein [Lachnospiraceae bacterium]
MDMIDQFVAYGLTRQEATLYIALLTEGELNGYEAAKLTGISRSNAYNGLAGLVDKGAAHMIEGSVTKYTPVNVEEFCNNKLRALDMIREELIKRLPPLKEQNNGYITIKGEKNILDKLKTMLSNASERVYLSMSSDLLGLVKSELIDIVSRSIKLVIITDTSFELEGSIIYYTDKKDSRIRLISDSKKVLTGDISSAADSTCLYSMNNNLVSIFKEMLQNEITLLNRSS